MSLDRRIAQPELRLPGAQNLNEIVAVTDNELRRFRVADDGCAGDGADFGGRFHFQSSEKLCLPRSGFMA
jgi:hypothetical protein